MRLYKLLPNSAGNNLQTFGYNYNQSALSCGWIMQIFIIKILIVK